MRVGIVVVRIPEGMFTVRKFFSLLPYSISWSIPKSCHKI
jgi:hypothetical protein